jgi:hypothetical protein
MTKKPYLTKTNHLLPIGELSPAQFERLCLWLVERQGYLRAEHLGASGNEQGRDVIAYKPTAEGEQLWYFQCKRYLTISAAQLIKEVEKYNGLSIADPAKKPFGIVFVTNATISAGARSEVREFCCKHDYECEFWARTELDLILKKYDDVVEEFFNLKPGEDSGLKGSLHIQSKEVQMPLWTDEAIVSFSVTNLLAAPQKITQLSLRVLSRSSTNKVRLNQPGAVKREFKLFADIRTLDEVDLLVGLSVQFLLPPYESDAFSLRIKAGEGLIYECQIRASLMDLTCGIVQELRDGFRLEYPIRTLSLLKKRKSGP